MKLLSYSATFHKNRFSKNNFISPWNCFKLKNWTSKSNKNRPYTENRKCIILKKYQNCILALINLSVSLYFIIFPPNQWSMMILYTEINILAFLLNFMIFHWNREILEKSIFFYFRVRKKVQNLFSQFFWFSWKLWYFSFNLVYLLWANSQ